MMRVDDKYSTVRTASALVAVLFLLFLVSKALVVSIILVTAVAHAVTRHSRLWASILAASAAAPSPDAGASSESRL